MDKREYIFSDNGSGEMKCTKEDRIFLYDLAVNCFENGSDGCEFILDDVPGLKLKTSIVFKVEEVNNDKNRD